MYLGFESEHIILTFSTKDFGLALLVSLGSIGHLLCGAGQGYTEGVTSSSWNPEFASGLQIDPVPRVERWQEQSPHAAVGRFLLGPKVLPHKRPNFGLRIETIEPLLRLLSARELKGRFALEGERSPETGRASAVNSKAKGRGSIT